MWNGEVVAVTGSGSGIGRGLAKELARQGVRALSLNDVNQGNLASLERELRESSPQVDVSLHCFDVRDEVAVRQWAINTVQKHGGVSCLINCAGIIAVGPFDGQPKEQFDFVMQINYDAAVNACRVFLPLLKRQRAAHIVNISSMFGFFASENNSSYHASKFALAGFTYALNLECRESCPNVQVHAVHPGFCKTNLLAGSIAPNAQIRKEAIAAFEMVGTTTSEQAAKTILLGVKGGKSRILVGCDAHMLDLVTRVFPESYVSNSSLRSILLGFTALQTTLASKLRDFSNGFLSDQTSLMMVFMSQYYLARGMFSAARL